MVATKKPSEAEIIIFASTHHMIHAEHKLRMNNIPLTLYPAPPEFRELCSTAITYPSSFKEKVELILQDNRIKIKGMYPFNSEMLQKTKMLIQTQLEKSSQKDAFLERILLEKIEMCIADPDKIRVFANFSNNVSEVMPYLNSVLPGVTYNSDGPTITFMKGPMLITIYPNRIAAAKVNDEKDAVVMLEWLRDIINDTHKNKDKIEPCYEQKVRLNPIELYKYLPGTNCKQCGQLTCLAFAVQVLSGENTIANCTDLNKPDFKEKRTMLFDTLDAMGFEIPE